MQRVIFEDIEYSYLQKNAKQRLKEVRQLAQSYELEKNNVIQLEGKTCCIFPWAGTVAYRTLERLLNIFVRESLDIRNIGGMSPYFLTVKLGKNNVKELHEQILYFCNKELTSEDLIASDEAPRLQKYDEFIPNNLLRKAFAGDYLDVSELQQILRSW
jgi:ATP-dependent Lhr-like helicase